MHEPPAARVAADTLTVPAPAIPVVVPEQVLFRLLGVETTRPEGSVSVNATPDRITLAFVLETVMVSEVLPLSGTVEAPKALLMLGGLTTVRVAVLGLVAFPAAVESRVTLLM